jgi:hypothetical protein
MRPNVLNVQTRSAIAVRINTKLAIRGVEIVAGSHRNHFVFEAMFADQSRRICRQTRSLRYTPPNLAIRRTPRSRAIAPMVD